MPLRRPTDDSRAISQAALMGLASIYQPGYRYAKAGVMLLSLRDAGVEQGELDLEDEGVAARDAGSPRLMQAFDAVNQRYGRGSVLLASAGLAGESLEYEAGAQNTGVHHLLGGHAGGARLTDSNGLQRSDAPR